MTSETANFKDTVLALISACGDKEETVNKALVKSLIKLASEFPNQVVEHICEYYKNNAKISLNLLANIIPVLEQTCVHHMKVIKKELATELVNCMLKAMTHSNEFRPVIQLGASAVLVAVGHVYLDLVLQTLLKGINPTSVPHYTIPHTLGTLSAVNTQDTVPFVKDILAKMLPLLSLVKVEGAKQAFAYAFGHFAVAVSEQIGDNVDNERITSIKDNFVVEFTIIFDVLYNQWLHAYEPQVIESVLEAIGPITRLISERKFDESINKMMLTILSLYKRSNVNPYYISQCISYLLTPSSLNPKLALTENVISSTNHILFNLVVFEPDYDQPQTVKNHFEVLRCFDHMAGQFPDQTIEGLLNQCKNNQEKDRMRAVIILTHLTTSSQIFTDKYASKFIALLKVMTNMEQGLKMKKLLVKAIVGLVYRNCIKTADDFNMVDFIVKHCGYEPQNASKAEINDLHDTCKSSLILLCNSATNVRNQLRDLLLKSLTMEELTSSMSIVCHCLTSLLQNNSNAAGDDKSDSMSEFKVSPDLVFVRCLTHLADPSQVDRNKNVLVFLEEYSTDVHKNLTASWAVEVSRLLKSVDDNEAKERWHEMLIDLLIAAIDDANSEKWIESVATLLSHQILATKQPPIIKGVSIQFLAVLACYITNVAVSEQMLKIITLSLKSIPVESVDYVSKAIGIASRQHGEHVMNELDAFYKDIESRRGMKLLNFISARHSKNEAEINVSKYAVIICYGKVARQCLDVHVLARLGENVTTILYEILKSNPPLDLCRASVTTLYEISRSLKPAPHHDILLRNRWPLLNAVLEQIYNPNLDKKNVDLFPIIVKASKALTKLQKGILPEERNTILRILFSNIFGELANFKTKYDPDGEINDLLAKTLNDSLKLLHDLIRELIIQATCLSTIDDLISLLIEWIWHKNDDIRTASFIILQVILDTYLKNVKLNFETPSKFSQMGALLGLILPGIADTNFQIRQTTLECVRLIVQIQYVYEGITMEKNDECMAKLHELSNNIQTNDLVMIEDYSKDLCVAICEKIPHNHIIQFVESLLEVYDDNEMKSSGSSAFLNELFLKKGQELFQSIEKIVELLLGRMEIVNEGSRMKLLVPLSSLARHHSNAVTAVLLAQKLPLKISVTSSWCFLARDESLSTAIVDNFLRLMSSIDLYEEPHNTADHHIAALQPLTLISALGEMLKEPSMEGICNDKFPELFAVLYTTMSCYLSAAPPAYCVPTTRAHERLGFVPNRDAARLSPADISLGAFYALLDRAQCQKVKEACIVSLSMERSSRSARELSPVVCSSLSGARRVSARLVTALSGFSRATLSEQRAAAIALLGDILIYDDSLSESSRSVIRRVVVEGARDAAGGVRAAAARRAGGLPRGEGLVVAGDSLDHQAYTSPIDNVPLAAMQGLSRMLNDITDLEKDHVRELLSISQKIRPFMNTDYAPLREHSIRTFGLIASKVQSENLVEQAITSLPCFLLHLCDSNPAVVRASKYTLKQIYKTFDAPKSNDLVQTHLVDEGRLYLDDFLTTLLKHMTKEMPASISRCLETAVNYLHCASEDMKPFPPLLIGKLYQQLHSLRDTHPELSVVDDEVTRRTRVRLLALLRDNNDIVRANSALALTYLCIATTAV